MELSESVEALWRIESPQLIATLARRIGDLDIAEDLASEAFVAALEQWPVDGVPPRPGAWLMTTAWHKAIDRARREETARRKAPLLVAGQDGELPDVTDAALAPIPDDLLTMLFTTCHPVLAPESRVALTLRLFGGLTTDEIARAFLAPSPTIGQRISRAKRTLAEARVPVEAPAANDLPQRLSAVLEVLYLIFNEGYSASSGETIVRADLAVEAMRMGRVLAGLLPTEPEVFGLVALMELQASRFRDPHRRRRNPCPARAPGPPRLGPDPDRPRPRDAGPGLRPRPPARPVHTPSSDLGLPCPRHQLRRH